MKWLDKNTANLFATEIKKHYESIFDKTHRNYGIVDDIEINGKRYLMRYDRNMGVHYDFTIYDGDEVIAKGDFPAVEVEDKYKVIRFYSASGAIISEYVI